MSEGPIAAWRCDRCAFATGPYGRIADGEGWELYRCHRYPPSKTGVFPDTIAKSWCGEWKQRTEIQDE